MALMRYVSLGAPRFRSGRYATRSRSEGGGAAREGAGDDPDDHEPDRTEPGRDLSFRAERPHHEQAAEPARHHDFGVGEVDEPEHAVDEGVAEGDERVEEAVGEAPDDERDPDVVVRDEPRTVHAFRSPPLDPGQQISQLADRGPSDGKKPGTPLNGGVPGSSQKCCSVLREAELDQLARSATWLT